MGEKFKTTFDIYAIVQYHAVLAKNQFSDNRARFSNTERHAPLAISQLSYTKYPSISRYHSTCTPPPQAAASPRRNLSAPLPTATRVRSLHQLPHCRLHAKPASSIHLRRAKRQQLPPRRNHTSQIDQVQMHVRIQGRAKAVHKQNTARARFHSCAAPTHIVS